MVLAMSDPRKRLFVGAEFPESVQAVFRELRTAVPGAEWVREENLHLTLKFIGPCDSERCEEVVRALRPIQYAPFLLTPSGVGVFPPRGSPGVMWVGLGTAHPRLCALQKAIDDALFAIGI